MPRRREVPKREILPDPKYHNVELAKFVNVLMTRGKKSVAERIIYGALEQIEKKTGGDPMEVFTQALKCAANCGSQKSQGGWGKLSGSCGSKIGAP